MQGSRLADVEFGHPGLVATGVAALTVTVVYLSDLDASLGPMAPLVSTLLGAVAGGLVAGTQTDRLRAGFPPGFVAFLLVSLVLAPGRLPTVGQVRAIATFLLPFAVLSGCASAIVAVVLDHRVVGSTAAGSEEGGETETGSSDGPDGPRLP